MDEFKTEIKAKEGNASLKNADFNIGILIYFIVFFNVRERALFRFQFFLANNIRIIQLGILVTNKFMVGGAEGGVEKLILKWMAFFNY